MGEFDWTPAQLNLMDQVQLLALGDGHGVAGVLVERLEREVVRVRERVQVEQADLGLGVQLQPLVEVQVEVGDVEVRNLNGLALVELLAVGVDERIVDLLEVNDVLIILLDKLLQAEFVLVLHNETLLNEQVEAAHVLRRVQLVHQVHRRLLRVPVDDRARLALGCGAVVDRVQIRAGLVVFNLRRALDIALRASQKQWCR